MILVSGCLLGLSCKYNGGSNSCPKCLELMKKKTLLAVCPEQLGGLATPRPPAEIQAGQGLDVLEGRVKIINKEGKDVSQEFIKGAQETLLLARLVGAKKAIFKERSPSCGVSAIYNGQFNGTLIQGGGVTTALLRREGLEVISNEDLV